MTDRLTQDDGIGSEPITLKDACEIVFKNKITVASLKAEHARGNLHIFKVGRAYFTTRNDLSLMRHKCHVKVPVHISGLIKSARSGQSSMEKRKLAQVSALQKLAKLKKSSKLI